MAAFDDVVIISGRRTAVEKSPVKPERFERSAVGRSGRARKLKRAGLIPIKSTSASWATFCPPASDKILRGRPQSLRDCLRQQVP